MTSAQPLTVYLPDTRGVELARYGIGNSKIGFGVYTFSRLAGRTATCPGSTDECEAVCYAKRITGVVQDVYAKNWGDDVPEIPKECQVLRIHVSGDFDSVGYIKNWITRIKERPEVIVWAYTRSWRLDMLLPALEELRALPNMQLFASIDPSTKEMPPAGWRRAWIWREQPHVIKTKTWPVERRLSWRGKGTNKLAFFGKVTDVISQSSAKTFIGPMRNMVALDRTPAFVCPEETGHKANCMECGYCFEGQKHDVVFLEH